MSTTSPAVRVLAGRLIAAEAARDDPRVRPAVRVCEKLRLPLSKLAGAAGFRSLLSRALAMAKAEAPSLAAVQVGDDGSLAAPGGEGHRPGAGLAGEGGVAVVAHLLGLLVTFIGEALALRLVGEVWPDAPAGGTDQVAGGEP